jgi:hypothetical protein
MYIFNKLIFTAQNHGKVSVKTKEQRKVLMLEYWIEKGHRTVCFLELHPGVVPMHKNII